MLLMILIIDPYLDVEGVNAIMDDMSPCIIDCCPNVCGVLLAGTVCLKIKKQMVTV